MQGNRGFYFTPKPIFTNKDEFHTFVIASEVEFDSTERGDPVINRTSYINGVVYNDIVFN